MLVMFSHDDRKPFRICCRVLTHHRLPVCRVPFDPSWDLTNTGHLWILIWDFSSHFIRALHLIYFHNRNFPVCHSAVRWLIFSSVSIFNQLPSNVCFCRVMIRRYCGKWTSRGSAFMQLVFGVLEASRCRALGAPGTGGPIQPVIATSVSSEQHVSIMSRWPLQSGPRCYLHITTCRLLTDKNKKKTRHRSRWS